MQRLATFVGLIALSMSTVAPAAEAPATETPEASAPASKKVLTLDEALDTARREHPSARQAEAQTAAAGARSRQALAPLLPQLGASASYQRSSANFSSRPGSLPSSLGGGAQSYSFQTYDYFNLGLSASQLLFDFGKTSGKYGAAVALADAQGASEAGTLLDVELNVRSAYFAARASRAMMEVAKETLANQERHLGQIQAFVEVGTRPKIDLVQARTDLANARVSFIQAQNSYETAKATLDQAMGVSTDGAYEVASDSMPEVPGEQGDDGALYDEALRSRPQVRALEGQVRAEELTARAARGGYAPSLSASAGLTDAGPELSNLTPNIYGGLTLSWDLFSGGATAAQVAEADATTRSLEAQLEALRQQIRLDVKKARLAVVAGVAAVGAAEDAVENARELLRLAEGRYETGSGSVIELSDAQLGLTSAQSQKVQADYDLASARAALLRALGRSA